MSNTETYHCWGCMSSWTKDDLVEGDKCPECHVEALKP